MIKLNAVIIDDEKNGRENLRNLLQKHCPEIEILDEAYSVESGADLLKNVKAKLVFLDIELGDGTGFDLLEKLNGQSLQVIFVTAYSQYAIKAFKYSAVDYLLKPIKTEELKSAVQRAKERTTYLPAYALQVLKENIENKTTNNIILPVSNGQLVVKTNDIVRCQSENNYTWFYFVDGKKAFISRTLKEYEELLSESGFYRVHQSHLINVKQVKQYIKGENACFILADGSKIPVSQRKKDLVKEILKQANL